MVFLGKKMNIILKIIILQFFLLASECQMHDNPHCDIQERPQEIGYDSNGNSYFRNVRTLNCYGGYFISEESFNQWLTSNYETDIIYFMASNFHTIPALTFHSLPDLREIYLNGTGITILEIGCFLGLKQLEILQLGENKIEEIEKGMLSSLPSLTMLTLSNNHLHEIHKNTFRDLINLEKLFLDGNNLHFLPDDLFPPLNKIQIIDLSRNAFETFNSSVFNYLSELEYLYINNNRLKYLPPYIFKSLSKLILLDISTNSLTSITYNVLSGLDELTHLNVSQNQLTMLKARDIDILNNLRELNIAYNNISSLNTNELAIFLPSLKEVYLNGNNWTCSTLMSLIRAFRMIDVRIKPGKHYHKDNINGIACTNSSINVSFTSFTNDNNGYETDESRFLQHSHILMEIAGKISDNNNLVEQLINANLNSSKNIQIIAENVQNNAIATKPSVVSHVQNQNISESVERTNNLLANILNELRIERTNTMNILQNLNNNSRVNDDSPRLNGMNQQPRLVEQNLPLSPPNSEIVTFMNNIKTELEISRTILDIFMKNISQTIVPIQEKVHRPTTPQNNNQNQLISERLQGKPSTASDAGSGNIAIIVCLCILVVILIIILGITYFQYKKGHFIVNGLGRYRLNRPTGSRSDTDLMANSRTLSNSEV